MNEVRLIKCDSCDLPVARMIAGVLIIESRHHGEKHTTIIQVGELVTIANEQLAEMRDRLSVLELVSEGAGRSPMVKSNPK